MIGQQCLLSAGNAYRKPRDHATTGSVASIYLSSEQLLPAMREALKDGYFLEDVCGLDTLEGFEIVYHLDRWDQPGRLTLRIAIPHDKPEAPSVASVFPAADWHERETFDMYGIVFTGHPDLKPLLLPEDSNIHPLLKEPADRVSIYHLFPDYDIIDCRPDFLKGDIRPAPQEPGSPDASPGKPDKPAKAGKSAGV
ncbi:MAG: NADH-quinone oxidoreductase subunit C [Desulfocurvibacter africanus]